MNISVGAEAGLGGKEEGPKPLAGGVQTERGIGAGISWEWLPASVRRKDIHGPGV